MTALTRNHVNTFGNSNATTTLLFGHGMGTDQTTFRDVINALEQDYRIVVYDNVGAGQADESAYNEKKYNSLQGYVTDLIEICNELELRNVVFIGQSISGIIGLLASNQQPGIFAKLVMIGSSPRYLNDSSRRYVGGFEQANLKGLYEAMESDYAGWARGFAKMTMLNDDRPHLAEEFGDRLLTLNPDIVRQLARIVFEVEARYDVQQCMIPVLIMQTNEDIAVPDAVGQFMENNIEHSTLIKLKVHGHFPHISAPQEVVDAIKSFI